MLTFNYSKLKVRKRHKNQIETKQKPKQTIGWTAQKDTSATNDCNRMSSEILPYAFQGYTSHYNKAPLITA